MMDARLDAASLRVACARKGGADASHAPPALSFGELEKNSERDMLHLACYPVVRFIDQLTDRAVEGTLTL